MFTFVRAGGRWVYPGSLDSLGFALGVVGYVWGCWVNSGLPWGSLGSSAVVGFTWVRPRGRLVHQRSLGTLGVALWAVGFIRRRCVY